jgi:putative two-component system response regulator
LRKLALAAERDEGASEHAERVATTAFALAQQLGISRRQAALIYQAAPLHDLGKIVVPAELLLKPGKLSASEFEQVKVHTTAGAGLLAFGDSRVLRLASEIALTHHERWDGSGYPAGLCGEDIPLSGRIVALADVFDALTHERPYKRAWSLEKAIAELRRLRGSHFDPGVVDAFLQPRRSGVAGISTPPPGSIAA